jgi:hypothetical protein
LKLSRSGDRRVVVLPSGGPTLMLGRYVGCSFVVEHDKTSRTHLKVETRGRGFTATDQSTNGSVLELDGRSLFLRRESVALTSSGWISPAGKVPLPEELRIHFQVVADASEARSQSLKGAGRA